MCVSSLEYECVFGVCVCGNWAWAHTQKRKGGDLAHLEIRDCPANMHTAAGGVRYESGAVATTLSLSDPTQTRDLHHFQVRFNPSCDKLAYIATDAKPYVVNYPAMTNTLISKTNMDANTGQALVWANDNSFISPETVL